MLTADCGKKQYESSSHEMPTLVSQVETVAHHAWEWNNIILTAA